jgi:sugar phosphate isomerase/epimerase
MYNFGLKLWSTNKNYVASAVSHYYKIYQYIELYTVPNSYNDFIELWKSLDIPYTIHAPHTLGGLNLSKKEMREQNFKIIEEVIKFANTLNGSLIIFHPGIDGDIEETVSQIKKIKDKRILIENKPYFGLVDNLICVGSSPSEIQFIMDNTGAGFCLDIGHAICSANAHKLEPLGYIKEFMQLKPKMYHLTDGDYNSVYDNHKHIGDGNFPVKEILGLLPLNSFITIETVKKSKDNLDDFIHDIDYLKKLKDNHTQ